MRVLFPFVSGELIGGSHVSALNLISGFDKSCVDPKILLHRSSPALEAEIKSRGLDYEVVEDFPVLSPRYSRSDGDVGLARYLFLSLPRYVRYLRHQKIDIVHTNDGRMHATWALPSRLARARLIWHHRAVPYAKGVNYMAPLLADRILSVSHFARPSRPVLSIAKKFKVVRSPMIFPETRPDRDENHTRLCSEIGAPGNALLLGYVGLLNERKRPVHFVEAVAKVIGAGLDRPVHGLIFGQDEIEAVPLEEACRQRAEKLGIAKHIHLMGFRKPINGEVAGLDALLVTALSEPFGRTLIEAMLLGTPVVATRHGGNVEAINDGTTGFLVDSDDPESFVEPIARLSREPKTFERVTRSALESTKKEFSCEYAAAAVIRQYEDVLGLRRCPDFDGETQRFE